MTEQQLENANELRRQIRAAQYLTTANGVEPSNFNYLYHNDKDFHAEFIELRNKYYDKYCELFKSL